HPETKKLDEVTAEVETIAKQKRSLIAELIEFSEDSQETDDDDYPTISKNINKILLENEISSELKEDSNLYKWLQYIVGEIGSQFENLIKSKKLKSSDCSRIIINFKNTISKLEAKP
ncbi:hypothetical protein BpHYR1_020763, partial [Brachionus plicatilis]